MVWIPATKYKMSGILQETQELVFYVCEAKKIYGKDKSD